MVRVRANSRALLRRISIALLRELSDHKRDCRCVVDSLCGHAWDVVSIWSCEVPVARQARAALVALDTLDSDVPADRHRGPAVYVDARFAVAEHDPGACDSLHRAQSSVCSMDDAGLFQRAPARIGRGSDGGW